MKKVIKATCLAAAMMISSVIFLGCSNQQLIPGETKRSPIYRLQIGINKGGIVENTDMTVIGNAGVDAFSGATGRGANASGKVILPLKRNFLETGIDLMYNSQTFTYNDANNSFFGERKLGVTQFMVPLTYSIGVLRGNTAEGLFQIKFGYSAQINMFSVSNSSGNLPDYSIHSFSNGATLGLSTTPIRLNNGRKLGFFVDGYRGTKAYDDFYNRTEFEIKGTSFVKYGVIFQF